MTEGSISIFRTNQSEGSIRIEVKDASSRTRFLEIDVQADTLMNVLTGLGEQPCEYKLKNQNIIGKNKEIKKEKIPRPKLYPHSSSELKDKELNKLLLPHQIDGWVAFRDDAYNCKNHCTSDSGDPMVEVGFTRYV